MATGINIDKDKALKLWENGLLCREMAKELGCSEKGVSSYMKRNGMASNVGIFDWVPSGFVDNFKRRYAKRGV